MVEKDHLPEFSLEDILREFGSHPEEDAPEAPQPQPPETTDDKIATESMEAAPEVIPDPEEAPVVSEAPKDSNAESLSDFDRDLAATLSWVLGEDSADTADGSTEDLSISVEELLAVTEDLIDSEASAPEPAPPAEEQLESTVQETAPSAEEKPESTDDDVQIFSPKAPVEPNSGDTIRLDRDAVRRAANTMASSQAETIRIDTVSVSAMTDETVRIDQEAVAALSEAAEKSDAAMDGATVAFTPVGTSDEEPSVPHASPIPEGAEPFSAGWEPKYEEPIGEYIPPEPIVFRPRSRLHEMKKKLIAGPERRYYALLEEGVGKLQVAIFISILIVILSTVSIVLNQMSMVQPDRMRLLVFGELFAMLFSAVLASDLIFNGLISIFRGRFTLNSLLGVTFLVCIADGIFSLKSVRVPYCAAFCLEVTAALFAEYQRRSTELGQMDTLRKATILNRISQAPDCFDGKAGFYTEDGEVEDFMNTYRQTTRPGQTLNLYALIAFLVSVGIAALAFVSRHDVAYSLQMWSAAILAAAPATIFLSHSRPTAILERRLHRYGVVLCGWDGIKAACGNAVVPLDDSDLFPTGSVKVNGVKIYSSKRDTDQIIAYTTALVELSGTVLAPLFRQMLESRYGHHYDVENFRIYENGGLSGDVCGESVLVGSREFLQEMGVRLPDGAVVNQGVYTAINGELCSVCAMAFGKLKGVATGLTALCSHRKISPMIVTNNFLLDESFVQEKFGIAAGRILFPSFQQRGDVSAWEPSAEASSICALSTQESLAATGVAITGARELENSLRQGTSLHILGGIVGMLIVLVLQFVDGGNLLTPANLLLFELIWSIPGLLITEWTRRL